MPEERKKLCIGHRSERGGVNAVRTFARTAEARTEEHRDRADRAEALLAEPPQRAVNRPRKKGPHQVAQAGSLSSRGAP